MRRFNLLDGVKLRISSALEWVLWAFAIYLIPIAVALVSLAALLFWDDLYSTAPEQHLELRVTTQHSATFTPLEAKAQLAHQLPQAYHDTKLSEDPVWFSFNLPSPAGSTQVVEFPSRHAVDLSCWDAASLQLLGNSQVAHPDSPVSRAKAGFTLAIDRATSNILCRASFVGPARLTAELWSSERLEVSVQKFHRTAGLFDGGLIVLALSVLMTALINRNKIYVLFAAWLVTTLRVGALSGGWDIQWLGHAIPQDWLFLSRSVTIAIYALLTLTLYKTLFRDDLINTRFAKPITVAQWLTLPLVVCSVVLPYKNFLPIMWLFTGIGLLLMTLSLGSIVIQTRSRVALWYSASLAVTYLSSLSEILAAAYGIKEQLGIINSVTAALASSLLASLAIAEQMRLEHQQRLDAQAELQHTYEAMPIGLFTLDLQGRFISGNPALHKMLNAAAPLTLSNAWAEQFTNGSWPRLHHMVYTRSNDGELEVERAGNGQDSVRRFLVKATLAGDRIEGSLQDITEKYKATQNLNFLANHDSLTKVLNRNGIETAFNSALAQLDQGKPLALAYLDLDRFKLINDLYGHNTGDEILRQMSQRLSRMMTGEVQIGRVGGDEFVIVMPDTQMSLATVICQGLVSRIASEPYRRGEKSFQVRGSIGLIEVTPGADFKDSISTADRACRDAKTSGKGLVVYESNSPSFLEHKAEIQLVEHLSASKTLEGLFLEMQPIMSLSKPYESLNFEVLLRMLDADGKRVPVGSLITAGEHSGHMSEIDHWVLSTTLRWLDTHRERLSNVKFVCINLNGASLNDETFLEEVFDMLDRNRHIASYLSIEITESVALNDLNNTRRFIDRVRSYGAKVALDDFGAGYTSFSYLKELPADLLKIDGSFIVDMNHHPANVSIVEAIVNLARNLGMKTIAEWAEDNATVQTLVEIGVDYVQGFAVARPQPPEAILSATSSASFIQDEELKQFAQRLGQSEDYLAQADLFGQDNSRNMH